MPDSIMYHDGNRRLQDQFDSRRISDRLEEKLTRTTFSADDQAFIESASYFFIATADAQGHPDCSFKGGMPGFVKVTGESEIAFPDYDGNGMFKSLRQSPGQSECRASVHRDAWQAETAAGERHGVGPARRSAARVDRRGAADGAGHGARDLSQLPALHSDDGAGRAFGLCAAAGLPAGRAGLEGFRRLQRLCASAPATARGDVDKDG